MANLQEIPLPEPENIQSTIEQDTTGSKTNSLKRFFKIGKKPNISQENVTEVADTEDDASKDSVKPGSISRFLTRFKGSNKSEPADQASSTAIPLDETSGRPLPNVKPTLKTSISGYWKLLFHRQKSANRQGNETEQQTEPEIALTLSPSHPEGQQIDPNTLEDTLTETPATSLHDLKLNVPPLELSENPPKSVPELIDEIQMLNVSEEIIESTQQAILEN